MNRLSLMNRLVGSFSVRGMATKPYDWMNKVVLMTGAATGIGARAVQNIVDEGVKHVAILDVAEAAGLELQNELNSKHGNKVKFYKCDVTNEELFLSIFDTVKADQDYIDVVVNNAGIMNDRPEVYRKEIQINVTSVITSTVKAIEIMRKDKGGRGGAVLNISSIAGLIQDPPMLPIYYATKSAVLQFSNCIGMNEYYSKYGVRVMAICFGATQTPLLSQAKLGHIDPEFEEGMMDIVKTFEHQSVESAAKGVVATYKLGESGSTWLVTRDLPAQDISGNVAKAYEILSTNI